MKENKRAFLAMLRFLRPLQKSLNYYLRGYGEWIVNSLNRKNDVEYELIKEMVDKGVSYETIGKYTNCIARTAFNNILYRLDDPAGGDYDLDNEGEDLPRWRLVEEVKCVEGDKIFYKQTGRNIYGMHSIFPFIDPSEEKK